MTWKSSRYQPELSKQLRRPIPKTLENLVRDGSQSPRQQRRDLVVRAHGVDLWHPGALDKRAPRRPYPPTTPNALFSAPIDARQVQGTNMAVEERRNVAPTDTRAIDRAPSSGARGKGRGQGIDTWLG